MDTVLIVLRMLHIAAVVFLGGGLVFQAIVLSPWMRAADTGQREAFRQRTAAAWTRLVWTCIAVLLLTGLVNYLFFQVPAYRPLPYKGTYHGLMGVKILLALAVFHAAAMTALPGPLGARQRERAPFWWTYGAVAVLVIVILGACLRYLPALYE